VGLPQNSIPLALLFFNLGVEAGQLLFIAFVVAVTAVSRRVATRFALTTPEWARPLPPYVIGGVAMFWVIQRVAAF